MKRMPELKPLALYDDNGWREVAGGGIESNGCKCQWVNGDYTGAKRAEQFHPQPGYWYSKCCPIHGDKR